MDILLSHIQFFHFLLTQNTLCFRWIQSYCVTNLSIFKTVSFDTLIGKWFFPMLAELVGEYMMRLFITMTPFASVRYSSSPAASRVGSWPLTPAFVLLQDTVSLCNFDLYIFLMCLQQVQRFYFVRVMKKISLPH